MRAASLGPLQAPAPSLILYLALVQGRGHSGLQMGAVSSWLGQRLMEISSVFLPGGLRKAQYVVGVESGSQRLNRLILSYFGEREWGSVWGRLQWARLEAGAARGPCASLSTSGWNKRVAHRTVRTLSSVHFTVLNREILHSPILK